MRNDNRTVDRQPNAKDETSQFSIENQLELDCNTLIFVLEEYAITTFSH